MPSFIPNFYARITVNGVRVDYYKIVELYHLTDPCICHALKKLLRAGRSHKSLPQDIQDAIDSLLRWQEMEFDRHPMAIADSDERPMGMVAVHEPVRAVEYLVNAKMDSDDLLTGWFMTEDGKARSGPFSSYFAARDARDGKTNLSLVLDKTTHVC